VDKRLTFAGQSVQGEPLVLSLNGGKRLLTKLAYPMLPQIQMFADNLTPDPALSYFLVSALGSGEVWGCFREGAPVTMADGSKQAIEYVRAGEDVITHRNRPRTVTEVFSRPFEGSMISVKESGFPFAWDMTDHHPVLILPGSEVYEARLRFVYRRNLDTSLEDGQRAVLSHLSSAKADVFVPANELKKGDYTLSPFEIGELRAGEVPDWLLDYRVARTLGRYAAEGCCAHRAGKNDDSPTKDSIVLVVGAHEDYAVAETRRTAEYLERKLQEELDGGAIRLSLGHSELARFALANIGRCSTEKFISSLLKRFPREWQKAFLGAYFSGDGSQHPDFTVTSSSASLTLALDIAELVARAFGVVLSVSGRIQTTTFGEGWIYESSLCCSQSVELVKFVERFEPAPECTARPECFVWEQYIARPIKSMSEYFWSGKVFNLAVAEDNSYLVHRHAVHNSNVNGDYFNEVGMLHVPTPEADWGYKTFETYGRTFRHHKNEDPNQSFGKVHLAVWNPRMHRVELVVSINKALAQQFGGSDLLTKLDQGQYPDVSMGTKVPFDVCAICNPNWKALENRHPKELLLEHFGLLGLPYGAPLEARLAAMARGKRGVPGLAIDRKEYCDHAKNWLGMTMPDGRMVYVVNLHPRFFDLSFVFMGADKSAKALKKIARSFYYRMSSAEAAEAAGIISPEMSFFDKVAQVTPFSSFVQKQAVDKAAEIDKAVASNLNGETIKYLGDSEPDIEDGDLRTLSQFPMGNVLSTLGGMGIALKPQEFQKIIIIKMGCPQPEWDITQSGGVFNPTSDVEPVGMGPDMFLPSLAKMLSGLIPDRSADLPALSRRVIQIVVVKPQHTDVQPSEAGVSTPLLDKVSAAYNGYRQALVKTAESCVPVVQGIPELLSDIYGDALHGSFFGGAKTASIDPGLLASLAIFGIAPAVYLTSAHLRRKRGEGQQLGTMGSAVANYPVTSAVALGLATYHGGNLADRYVKGKMQDPRIAAAVRELKDAWKQHPTS
jgi:hypothetical protein